MLNRRLYLSSIVSCFLITFLYLYYFFDLSITSPFINDVIIAMLMLLTISLLIHNSLLVRNGNGAGLVLFQIVMFAILIRAVPILSLYYQIWPDSHALLRIFHMKSVQSR